MEEIVSFIVQSVAFLGYWGIILLMFIESSFVPFPSEVVMVPAGYLAYKGEMSFSLVVVCGIVGSLAGALFNYYFALIVGRRFLKRYGKHFFLEEEKLEKVERFFADHGPFSTFTGRLIPVIRQLISVPAGLARMNIAKFTIYTSLGAGIWMIVLTAIGYIAGHNEALIKEYKVLITIAVLSVVAGMTIFYVYRHRKSHKKNI